ncbi:MAG: hypothetical protein GXY33_06545 [Phycisphaerae bacterium]|nr:hypothetical protein [Phycisphaerae bacterium]
MVNVADITSLMDGVVWVGAVENDPFYRTVQTECAPVCCETLVEALAHFLADGRAWAVVINVQASGQKPLEKFWRCLDSVVHLRGCVLYCLPKLGFSRQFSTSAVQTLWAQTPQQLRQHLADLAPDKPVAAEDAQPEPAAEAAAEQPVIEEPVEPANGPPATPEPAAEEEDVAIPPADAKPLWPGEPPADRKHAVADDEDLADPKLQTPPADEPGNQIGSDKHALGGAVLSEDELRALLGAEFDSGAKRKNKS